MSYDFMTLSPEDFEHLTRDLLSHEWGSQLEAFKSGRDAGIDLRHSRFLSRETITIVQCKRYAPDKFGSLVQALRAEVPKLKKLHPERYVLVTSTALSPHYKELLCSVIYPWCKGPQDIYGPSDLNGMLNRYPDIEKAHFKLWISSTAALERILNARIFNLTEDTLAALKNQMCRLVAHDGFERALNLLHQNHHALIVGNPGIGKTTLARMLMCHYVQEGFQPLVIMNDISDAWASITAAISQHGKAVILYDDFLGQVRFNESKFLKNEESSLFQFLARVKVSPNLRFILTTREYFLADAERLHGVFQRQAQELAKCTISLEDYTDAHRARILFNHLYFSDLPEGRLRKLVEQKAYRRIVAHRHFNPRIVEGISTWANTRSISDEDYLEYIKKEFDDPSRVWDHPFKHQISPTSRQLLVILWTFGGTAERGVLEESLLAFNDKDRTEEVALRFQDSLRELDGNFVRTERYEQGFANEQFVWIVKFQNPSVEEYVENFLGREVRWVEQLVRNITRFRQVEHILSWAAQRSVLPTSFWVSLHEAGKRTEFGSSGRLINYAGRDRPIFSPDDGVSMSFKTLTILKVATKADRNDSYAIRATMRVTVVQGWSELFRDIPTDESEAYAVKRILQWVMKDSGWTSKQRQECSRAFRVALVQLLLSDEIWPATLQTIQVLADCTSLTYGELEPIEKQAFEAAARTTTETAVFNLDEADTLDSEAEALKAVAALAGFDCTAEANSLSRRALTLRECAETSEETGHDDYRYKADYHPGYDVDALFSTLLDR